MKVLFWFVFLGFAMLLLSTLAEASWQVTDVTVSGGVYQVAVCVDGDYTFTVPYPGVDSTRDSQQRYDYLKQLIMEEIASREEVEAKCETVLQELKLQVKEVSK